MGGRVEVAEAGGQRERWVVLIKTTMHKSRRPPFLGGD